MAELKYIQQLRLVVPVDLLRDAPQVSLSSFQRLLADADAQRLYADIVDVVSLIENYHTLLLHLPGHNAGHLGVEQVLVAVHDNIGVLDHLPGKEVRADPALPPERAEVGESVHPRRHEGGEVAGGSGPIERLVELAQRGGFRVGGGLLADP